MSALTAFSRKTGVHHESTPTLLLRSGLSKKDVSIENCRIWLLDPGLRIVFISGSTTSICSARYPASSPGQTATSRSVSGQQQLQLRSKLPGVGSVITTLESLLTKLFTAAHKSAIPLTIL